MLVVAQLPNEVTLRLLTEDDADRLASAYRVNRDHLAQWDPARPESFFATEDQRRQIVAQLAAYHTGRAYPLILVRGESAIGRITVSGIVRGAMQSGSVGYWIDQAYTGQGLATAALLHTVAHARDVLDLHRLEASTLVHNVASQAVLTHAGFEQIGLAPKYLSIAGRWQDHLLFQLILHD